MRHLSPTLATLVGKTAWQLRGVGGPPTGPDLAELKRVLHRGIGELRQTRPRLVEFAPRLALRRVLASPGLAATIGGGEHSAAWHGRRPSSPARR
jgi:hypothetical protein